MTPLTRRHFERRMRHLQFKRHWQADGTDEEELVWTKACYKGCTFLKIWMDPSIYDPEVLGLEMEKIEAKDCGHEVPVKLSAVPLDDPDDLPPAYPTIPDEFME